MMLNTTAPSSGVAYITAVHNWINSSLAAGRPWVKVFDSWGAITNPLDTTNHYALPGTMDSLNKHPQIFAAQKVGDALNAAIQAAYPSLTAAQDGAPTGNNWLVCSTNAAATTYSSTNSSTSSKEWCSYSSTYSCSTTCIF
jgi:hypothetical protein